MYLTDQFLSTYKNVEPPFGGNGLGYFVYLRTYSRWQPDKMRRENWLETCKRVVDYSISLYQGPATYEELQKEAESMFDAMYHMRVFPSGRTMWTGGTVVSKLHGESNFNCAALVVDNLSAFWETFYLLLLGAGVGFRILPEDVNKLPRFNTTLKLYHQTYNARLKEERLEDTEINSYSVGKTTNYLIEVGDSKEGWVESLKQYLLTAVTCNDNDTVTFNYDSVRSKGEPLKTFGGRASGHEALKDMFEKIHRVISKSNGQLKSIEVMDIMNFIGQNVVSGGVRRTSEIALFAPEDTETLNAKVDLWVEGSENYGNDQRGMSNNSVVFEHKPSKKQLLEIFQRISHNGEPGFYNIASARKRRPNAQVGNPCMEIILDSRGMCNLCEINLTQFVTPAGHVKYQELHNSVRLAVRMGLRQTNITLSMPKWDEIQKRDRLLGVSLSGITDFERMVNWNEHIYNRKTYDTGRWFGDKFETKLESRIIHPKFAGLLNDLNYVANFEAQIYAFEMRVPAPLLVTTIKPSGSISKLPFVSSGVHRHLIRQGIRRVRISGHDPLARVMKDVGYRVYPEAGMTNPMPEVFDSLSKEDQDKALEKAATWVVEFPVNTDAEIIANEESATDQLKRYLDMQQFWTDHNTSVTITFSPDEVNDLVEMLLDNWDDYIAVSFLPKFEMGESTIPLIPEENTTLAVYEERQAEIAHVTQQQIIELLQEYEFVDMSTELADSDCVNGVCPIR